MSYHSLKCKKVLLAIRIENILLIVKTKRGKQNNILFINILYIFSLFINLIFSNQFLKKSYYFYYSNLIVNSCSNNIKIILAFIQNWLFNLKLYKKLKKLYIILLILSSQIVISHNITLI